jgi:hypothetical protein
MITGGCPGQKHKTIVPLRQAYLRDKGDKIVIDGLWGLGFGNGHLAGPQNVLLPAGPDEEVNGYFGKIVFHSDQEHTLTVHRSPEGGSVTSNPGGIDCGTTCVAVFDPGTVVTLTATVDEGSMFVGGGAPARGRS